MEGTNYGMDIMGIILDMEYDWCMIFCLNLGCDEFFWCVEFSDDARLHRLGLYIRLHSEFGGNVDFFPLLFLHLVLFYFHLCYYFTWCRCHTLFVSLICYWFTLGMVIVFRFRVWSWWIQIGFQSKEWTEFERMFYAFLSFSRKFPRGFHHGFIIVGFGFAAWRGWFQVGYFIHQSSETRNLNVLAYNGEVNDQDIKCFNYKWK